MICLLANQKLKEGV